MIVKTLDHLNLISKKIANKISKKDNIYLFGEIGVGKTTFARNLINNLQLRENVKATNVLSPTYNIMFEYKIKKLKVLHYDFYRLGDMEEIEKLGFRTACLITGQRFQGVGLKLMAFIVIEIHLPIYVKK